MKTLTINVTKTLPDTYRVTWESPELLPDDNVTVLRSEAAFVGFEPVAGPFKAYITGELYDQLVSHIDKVYYKIRITRGSEEFLFPEEGVAGVSNAAPLSTIVLQRRKHLAMNFKRNGVEVLYYKKRLLAMRCPVCVDPTTDKQMFADCDMCYGTGYVGGYYTPLKLHVLLSGDREFKGVSTAGFVETAAVSLKIPGWLEPFPGDVVRDPAGDMWEISNKIRPLVFQRGVIQYDTIAVKVEPHSAAYRLPVPEQPVALKFKVKTYVEAW